LLEITIITFDGHWLSQISLYMRIHVYNQFAATISNTSKSWLWCVHIQMEGEIGTDAPISLCFSLSLFHKHTHTHTHTPNSQVPFLQGSYQPLISSLLCISFFFPLVVLGFKLRSSHLLSRFCNTWAMLPTHHPFFFFLPF
jgi:hypothetical protein